MTHDMLRLSFHITSEQQGQYLLFPFTMPAGVEKVEIAYHYTRYAEEANDTGRAAYKTRKETNIIDLGLIAPDGSQAGASGSDKRDIFISERSATPGYHPTILSPGEWRILAGAYKVAAGGVDVEYEITFTYKHRRWLRGDLHTHTIASDGVLTAEELGRHAAAHGLDFLAITDHNQPVARAALPHIPNLTLIPGVEWTHYLGHANFLGVDRPYDGPFAANTPDEIAARFHSARERGALISINHPFEECCEFRIDRDSIPFDLLEVWNGPFREANFRSLGLWHSLLAAGQKIPICGGSDYHRDTPFLFLGGPTTAVYAHSRGASDILAALRAGHAYITYAPNGPWLHLHSGEAMMGDSLPWSPGAQVRVHAGGLLQGDVVRLVSATSADVVAQMPADGEVQLALPIPAPGFARVEVLRQFLPGIPPLPAILSNPIYFD